MWKQWFNVLTLRFCLRITSASVIMRLNKRIIYFIRFCIVLFDLYTCRTLMDFTILVFRLIHVALIIHAPSIKSCKYILRNIQKSSLLRKTIEYPAQFCRKWLEIPHQFNAFNVKLANKYVSSVKYLLPMF